VYSSYLYPSGLLAYCFLTCSQGVCLYMPQPLTEDWQFRDFLQLSRSVLLVACQTLVDTERWHSPRARVIHVQLPPIMQHIPQWRGLVYYITFSRSTTFIYSLSFKTSNNWKWLLHVFVTLALDVNSVACSGNVMFLAVLSSLHHKLQVSSLWVVWNCLCRR